jgi:Glycosyl transferases group 1
MDGEERVLVQVVGPTDGWILERLARRLAAKLPYAEFVPWKPRRDAGAGIAYYVNYALYEAPSGLIDVGFFTHCEDEKQFLERARAVDFCVSMSRQYADWLRGQGVQAVAHIPMGVDLLRYRPRLVLGVIGLLDQPRKGRELVERIRELPFVNVLVTEGQIPDQELPELYQHLDYVLIPSTVEGGPMSLLEGLAMGKPVIAPEGVGMVPEFDDRQHVRRYKAGDAEALVEVVTACYQEKLDCARLVQDRSWGRWAEAHHQLFTKLLRARGDAPIEPAPAFRFGMMSEMEVPFGIDVDDLETAVDQAARHLFYGRYRQACETLEEAAPKYPCVSKLLATIPREKAPLRQASTVGKAHVKALR